MISCLIIEDEPVARNILKQFIADTDLLELKGECEDAVSAIKFLKETKVDLIFLDIHMPKLSGIGFLKSLADPSEVIITTAYSEYALEGFELDVTDYLLKPFSFERFLKAINKLDISNDLEASNKTLFLKADGKSYNIPYDNILYIESKGDYVTLHTREKKLTYYETLSNLSEKLPEADFIRVHRSHIVSLSKIDYVEGNQVSINKKSIPIGNAFKEKFLKRFQA